MRSFVGILALFTFVALTALLSGVWVKDVAAEKLARVECTPLHYAAGLCR